MDRRAGAAVGAAASALLLLAPPAEAGHASWTYEVQREVDVRDAAALAHETAPHLWSIVDGDLQHSWWTGSQWRDEVLDGAGGGGGRVDGDLHGVVAQLFGGQPHVYYVDVTNGHLRHAWWTHEQWSFETVDGDAEGRGAGQGSTSDGVLPGLALTLLNERPRVFYRSAGADGQQHLRRARWTGQRWSYRTLRVEDEPVQGLTAAAPGGPHVWTAVGPALRHLWWDGEQWREERLAAAGAHPGPHVLSDPVAAVDPAGRVRVLFEDSSAAQGDPVLREAWQQDGRWRYRDVAPVGNCPCVPWRSGEELGVWFQHTHETNSGEVEMRHARLVGDDWVVEPFGQSSSIGIWGRPLAATGTDEQVHVWFASYIRPQLWHASAPAGP